MSKHVLCVFFEFWLHNLLRATMSCTFSTSQLPSTSAPHVVYFAHFDFAMCFAPQPLFNISTSKSALRMLCFVRFHFEMCFAPQPCALFHNSTSNSGPNPRCFQHCNFKICFVHVLSSDSLSSLIFFLVPFSALTLPTSAASFVHIVGSLTSKLPSHVYITQRFPMMVG